MRHYGIHTSKDAALGSVYLMNPNLKYIIVTCDSMQRHIAFVGLSAAV